MSDEEVQFLGDALHQAADELREFERENAEIINRWQWLMRRVEACSNDVKQKLGKEKQ